MVPKFFLQQIRPNALPSFFRRRIPKPTQTFSETLTMKIKLIANPIAGGNALASIRRAQEYLAFQGCTVELTLTGARGDAKKAASAAKHAGFDRIIAAGGDGTLNEVINGLSPSAIPLAFLPLGTTNVFALEAGIPFDVEQACAIALNGTLQPVCLGLAGETRFLLMAGAGFDADVVYRVSGRLKRWTGKLAYLVSGLRSLAGPPPAPIEVVREDGTTVCGYHAIIGNGRLYGGRFSVTPDASLAEGALDVCVFLQQGRLSLLRCAAKIAAGRRLTSPEAETFKARSVSVRGEGVPVQIDGDYLGRLPMTFRALPGELVLVLPAGS
jgi:YegS/Rv2252/BmrU family lipid kinase